MCDLCKVGSEETIFLNDDFFSLLCRTCKVSMIVLKEHRPALSEGEKQEVEELRKRYFPDKQFRGFMRSIPEHWHDHLINKGG